MYSMTGSITIFFAFVASGFAQSALSNTPQPTALDRLSFESSFSFTGVNSQLIRNFGGLSKSPDWMTGTGFEGRIAYQINNRVGLFVSYESSKIHGSGPWQPSGQNQQEIAAGVTGYAKGKVGTESYGAGPGTSILLYRGKTNWLSVEGAAMRFQRTTRFTGQFYGNDGQGDFVAPASYYQNTTGFQPVARLVWSRRLFRSPILTKASGGFGLNGAEFKLGLELSAGGLMTLFGK